MNHQITLEEVGIIPTSEPPQKTASTAIIPCYDCICNHCANNPECADNCTGEMDELCCACESCKHYDGSGVENWRYECSRYKITNQYAEKKRKRFQIMKRLRNMEREGVHEYR